MTRPLMTIDGAVVDSSSSFGVIDPSTGAVFAQAPECSTVQLDAAMAAAVHAWPAWRADDAERVSGLLAAADRLDSAVDEMAHLLTAEQGKPLAAARYEIRESARWLRAAAGLDMSTEVIATDPSVLAELHRRSLGVVAAITPWNFPVLLAVWKIGPALRAGNTMVVKPSPYTPLATLRLGELLGEVLPRGVVNVVSGRDPLGALITGHGAVAKISFTGSIPTGKAVMAAAAGGVKRLTLELGGNDAAIVLDDADPAAIGRGLFWGAFTNAGQVCAGIKRLFVPEALHDAVVEVLVELARKVRIGPGTQPDVQMGPIQNLPQLEKVSGLVSAATSSGAQAVAGGTALDGPGYFFPPTVLVGATEGMRVVDEEQFGPVLPVLAYRSLDEAVERANATQFGLCGSVWSSDTERATAVAERLDCGTAFVNEHLALAPEIPFGGFKQSGLGVENGPWGLDEFTQFQVVRRAAIGG
jgi:acyl-CoA reductase-like NAD-dependent aldehyde dehydrogenase